MPVPGHAAALPGHGRAGVDWGSLHAPALPTRQRFTTLPITRPADAPHKAFGSLKALKGYLQQQHKLQFCDICLEGRKVGAAVAADRLAGTSSSRPLQAAVRRCTRAGCRVPALPLPAASPGTPSPPCPLALPCPAAGVHQRAAAVHQGGAGEAHAGRRRGGTHGAGRLQGAPRVQVGAPRCRCPRSAPRHVPQAVLQCVRCKSNAFSWPPGWLGNPLASCQHCVSCVDAYRMPALPACRP